MSGELVPLAEMGIVPSKFADDKVFAGMSSGGFLGRLQLFGSNSDAAKEGKIAMGNYGLVSGKDIEDLGKEVNVIILSWRPKALQIDQAENTVITVFDHTDAKFRDIQNRSEEPNSGCMFGQLRAA